MSVILPFKDKPEVAGQMYNAMKMAVDEVNASKDRMAGQELILKVYSDGEGIYETSQVLTSMLESNSDILHIGVRVPVIHKTEELIYSDKFINYLNDYIPVTVQAKNAVRIFLSGTQICEAMGSVVDRNLLEGKSEMNVIALGVDDLVTRSNVSYLRYEVETSQIKFQDVYFKKGETNFDIFVQQIQNINADYIFVMSSGEEYGYISKALKDSGFKGKLVFASKVNVPMSLASYYFVDTDFSSPENAKFIEKYKALFEKKPSSFEAAFAYDSIILSAKAYNADPKNMREFFLGKSFEGAVGSIEFDSTGDSKVKVKALSSISIE